ncbi:MAG: hypothetical protein ACRDH2_05680 [Anaerolineales bacterium]
MNLSHELAVLKKMADELNEYLLSEVLFWQLTPSPSSFPKLSLGLMLLTRARLQGADALLDAGQRAERDQTERQIETTLGKWQVAAENKAEKELRSRLNLWQRFLDECRQDGESCADNYPHEVTQRAIISLLLNEFPRLIDTPEAKRLTPLDTLVRGRLTGDEFIWPAELQSGFPEAEFWYLYGGMG